MKRNYDREKASTVYPDITGSDFSISGKFDSIGKQRALKAGRKRAIEKGDISALVTQKTYDQTARKIYKEIVGTKTSDGIMIIGMNTHFIDRIIGIINQAMSPLKKIVQQQRLV